MESHTAKSVTDEASRSASAFGVGTRGLGIALFVAGWMWIAVVAPAAMTFVVSVATSVAWCMWLDKHPD